MGTEFQYDVFLSHNMADKPLVRRLAERLRAAGLRVWYDEWVVRPGDDIYLAIERGLEAARVQVLCLSPVALGSNWVALERSTALFRDPINAGRRFVPLLLVDCELPDTLRRYKYVDFRGETEAALEELLIVCRGPTEAGLAVSPTDAVKAAHLTEPVKAIHPTQLETSPGKQQAGLGPSSWVRVTWIAFLLSAAAAAGLIASSQHLAQSGLTSSIYFIVLFPLGLAAAGFLFGALRSSAKFVGKRYGATLQLGGPVVIFVMVILGGLTIAHPENTFSLLVRVHGPAGPSDVIGHGKATLDLGTDRRGPLSISDRGEVSFNEIPTQFAGKTVPLWADVPGFAVKDSGLQTIPPTHVIYLAMVPLPPKPKKIGGLVKDEELNGVGGVRVFLPSLSVETTTNDDGHFELSVADPGERDLLLRTERKGYLPTEQYVTAGNTDLGFVLKKGTPLKEAVP